MEMINEVEKTIEEEKTEVNSTETNSKNEPPQIDNTTQPKKNIPEAITLINKSERFIKIIEGALELEKIEESLKKARKKNKDFAKECKKHLEEIDQLKALCEEKDNEISILKNKLDELKEKNIDLKEKINNQTEVIGIVTADKAESEQEYKNSLAAMLKMYYIDYIELKNEKMTVEIGEAMTDTLKAVFDTLERNDIHMSK